MKEIFLKLWIPENDDDNNVCEKQSDTESKKQIIIYGYQINCTYSENKIK